MKKKIILRGTIGIPTGITIGYLITIFSSLVLGKGYYSPCVPELVSKMGNEINAVILQTILCALIGVVFGSGSVVWEMEHWSIAKQTGIYFLISSFVMMPTAWFLRWMEHTVTSFLSYLGIYVMIFILIWLTQYLSNMHDVKKINEKLK
ncbi:MAG: DUF3021 domain-containing protein [Lachnospiraceae bacterium]|nr:DUF3021 domain-containing protein [Lachnospiraceae bacterium]